MPVLLTFESNWQLGKEILKKIIHDHTESLSKDAERKIIDASKKYMIFYQHLTPIVYTSVEDSGILLTMWFICDPRKRRSTENMKSGRKCSKSSPFRRRLNLPIPHSDSIRVPRRRTIRLCRSFYVNSLPEPLPNGPAPQAGVSPA